LGRRFHFFGVDSCFNSFHVRFLERNVQLVEKFQLRHAPLFYVFAAITCPF
jgi:hypothetical protein